MSTFLLEIVTPERKVYEQEVEMVNAPAVEGPIGILPNHIPLVTPLDIGPLTIVRDGDRRTLAVSGGFMEVTKGKVTILAETAESAEDIDLGRASAARERAQKRLQDRLDDVDHRRAELALQRALNRMRVAGNEH